MIPSNPLSLVEPTLSLALGELTGPAPDQVAPILAGARQYLTLFKQPETQIYDPLVRLAPLAQILRHPRREIHMNHSAQCKGDPDVVAALVMACVQSAEVDEESILRVTMDLWEDIPAFCLELDGPGRFPNPIHLGGGMLIPWEEAERRWTAATRGGRIDRSPGMITMRLTGIREPEEPVGCPAPFLAIVTEAHQKATRIPETTGLVEAALRQALAIIDGPTREEVIGLRAVTAEVAGQWQELLESAAITISQDFPDNLPPLVTDRSAMVRVVAGVLCHTWCALPRGGRVSLTAEYDQAARQACMTIIVEGTQCRSCDSAPLASVRRAVLGLVGGSVEAAAGPRDWLIMVRLDDQVGMALDAWLPGWDGFTDKAQTMLRLLKSGGQAPPESLILDGILESELERWLIPVLSAPPAVNRAHDLKPDVRGLDGGSDARATKALEQIRKGKPRKEICHPPHSGEIAWVFREEPGRNALQAQRLSQEAMENLARTLVRTPTDALAALRILARRLRAVEADA